MLSASTIGLIIIIGLLIYVLFYCGNGTKETFREEDEIVDDAMSWFSYNSGESSKSNITKHKLNPNFVNIQFHTDYRDVITALLNIVPSRRQIFNIANVPLTYSEPEAKEVKNLLTDFAKILNQNLVSEVPLFRNANSGWDEAIQDPQPKESGWDKVQKALGLPSSLYNTPAGKAPITIIHIRRIQKYETEDEIKYVIEMVMQKQNVKDQMIVKGHFLQDKRILQNEDNFFINKRVEMKIIIEEVYIVGFLSEDGPKGDQQELDMDMQAPWYFDYDKLEKNNMVSPKHIQKVLMDKYAQRSKESEQRNGMLDEEGQDFHKTLPNVYDYSNITGTRTIFDDMNEKKVFY